MQDKPRQYVILWHDDKTGLKEPWYTDGPHFFGFMKSMKWLEEIWDAMMRTSRENALHWVDKGSENGHLR